MSLTEKKANIQVSCPGQIFPFGPPSHPNSPLWCRFSIPDRIPLKPFRQDRLTRLPFVMATGQNNPPTETAKLPDTQKLNHPNAMDPTLKIQQLEENLKFVQDSHAMMLKSLHEEISDLKQRNRELLFEIIMGIPALSKETCEEIEDDVVDEEKGKFGKLEKEIKKLRGALKDALKANSHLSNQLHTIKRENYSKRSSRSRGGYKKIPPGSASNQKSTMHSPSGPSPQMEDYSDTLRQIQRAASRRSGKHEGKHYCDEEWTDVRARNGKGYHSRCYQHNYHHQQEQHRLPRLPLRNHQNFPNSQYEIPFHQSHGNVSILPALAPLVNHRLDKSRKSRSSPKFADQAIN